MLSMQRILYGPLRPIEVEQLYEKAWFAVTETCLAMTIFREEVGGWFVVMFISLLIGKVWGWIGEGRVEILEQQPPQNPRLFHARLSTSLCISILFDMFMLSYCVQTIRQQARPNMMVMFAFEFAVLAVTSLSTFARYTISLYEAAVIKQQTMVRLQERRVELLREERERERERARARARATDGNTNAENTSRVENTSIEEELEALDVDVPGWEDKGRFVFYLDLATGMPLYLADYRRILMTLLTDFFKLTLYLTFFCVLCMFYGMPIHIIRDVAMTIKSFYKRITDFIKYRHATKDMNDRYPDATAEEIAREDTCIICREPMRPWGATAGQDDETASGRTESERQANNSDERLRPKKLPCNHILHFACLRSWLERQQNCPTCRQPVLVPASVVRNPPRPQMDREIGLQAGAPAHAIPVPGGNEAPQAAQNRIRFFDLGPIRFGFGAGRDINGLAEQLDNPAIPHHRREPPDNGAVRTFGFGLRLNRQPAAAQFSPSAIQTQLLAIEQQLMREINGLQAHMDQLHLIRALQGELARLRIAQANNNATVHTNNMNLNHPVHQSSFPQSAAAVPLNLATMPAFQAFSNNPQRPVLYNGHPDLPAGLVLPEGWSLMPLHRLTSHAGSGVGVTASQNGPTTEDVRNDHSAVPQPTSIPSSDPGPSSSQYQPAPQPSSGNIEPNQGAGVQSTVHTRSDHVPDPSNTTPSLNNAELPEQHPRASPPVPYPRFEETSTTNDVAGTIPHWGTKSHEGQTTDSTTSGVETTDEQASSSAERRAAKGKGRATTVEDFDDSVD